MLKGYSGQDMSKINKIQTGSSIRGYDEEVKSKIRKPNGSYQQTQFGDNYGRVKHFSKPDEEE